MFVGLNDKQSIVYVIYLELSYHPARVNKVTHAYVQTESIDRVSAQQNNILYFRSDKNNAFLNFVNSKTNCSLNYKVENYTLQVDISL